MAITPATQYQVPEHAIMDLFGKQAYLGNQYTLSSGVVALADTAEHPLLYLANAVGSGKALFCSMRKYQAAIAAGAIVFRLYWNPVTITSGSAATPVKSRIGNTVTSGVASGLLSPAAVSNGTLISTTASSFSSQNIDKFVLVADPGTSLLMTAQAAAATSCIGEFVWWEI